MVGLTMVNPTTNENFVKCRLWPPVSSQGGGSLTPLPPNKIPFMSKVAMADHARANHGCPNQSVSPTTKVPWPIFHLGLFPFFSSFFTAYVAHCHKMQTFTSSRTQASVIGPRDSPHCRFGGLHFIFVPTVLFAGSKTVIFLLWMKNDKMCILTYGIASINFFHLCPKQ